ncbi:hypothetical protein LCGC14_2298910 [marine sediment metagenome]|uniref:Uncharacterized protein n=1 Tax=marine sediment metagenome TaxID=412755 RepID=A0A0F9F1G2_9ZZZZ
METFEEKFQVVIKGISPLLHHQYNMEKTTKGLSKSGISYDPKEEAEKVLYTDESDNPVQPANHIEGAMVKEATNFKIPGQGKKTFKDAFKAGIFIDPVLIPHKFPKWVIDNQTVVVVRARIVRSRPRFDKWELEFIINNIDERITPEILKMVLEGAGRFKGIGDYRPKYGRFDVIKFEKVV